MKVPMGVWTKVCDSGFKVWMVEELFPRKSVLVAVGGFLLLFHFFKKERFVFVIAERVLV